MFDPGELDQIIVIQTEQRVSDGAGGAVKTWVDDASPATRIKAHVRPMSGRERYNSQQTEANANYLIVMRPRAINEKQRIVWKSVSPEQVLNIRFIKRKPRARYLELECEIADT